MRKVFLIAVTLIPLISLTVSCDSTVNTKLEDTKWFLRSYGEENRLISIIDGTEITVNFNSADDTISGSAGCNTYFAEYETKDSRLSISEMAHTAMACLSPEGVMEQEQDYLGTLTRARSFEADDTTLTIFCSRGEQINFTAATR